jgi:hypothetical protein
VLDRAVHFDEQKAAELALENKCTHMRLSSIDRQEKQNNWTSDVSVRVIGFPCDIRVILT